MKNLENLNINNSQVPILKDISNEHLTGTRPNSPKGGFAKVLAGGKVVRLHNDKSFLERMITGPVITGAPPSANPDSSVVLESIKVNLEAGIELIDKQETALAKIGGKLSTIALLVNKARAPKVTKVEQFKLQEEFIRSRDEIRNLSLETFNGTTLFSHGKSKPITIAVPSFGRWEGLSIDRSDLGQPGLITIDHGKVYGDATGYLLDSGSIKHACSEWRSLCLTNRMQWGLLSDRLHGINNCLSDFYKKRTWRIPNLEKGTLIGPLRRPNQNN